MTIHFQREVDKLKKQILTLSAIVEDTFRKAVRSVEDRDAALARAVIDADARVDRTEVDVEEECLKILALYQPVAADLRFIVAILKINADLERIGDLAVNIAERALALSECARPELPFDLAAMADRAQLMLKEGLDAMMGMDADIARRVCAADDEVDAMHRRMYAVVKETARRDPAAIDMLLHYLLISRNLERIADHATNIAEDLIYMIEGAIVRHSEAPNA